MTGSKRVKEPKKKWLWTGIVLLYVGFIFSNSMKPADLSTVDSTRVLELIRSALFAAGISPEVLTEHIVRKAAHFSEYTLYGVLLCHCLRFYKAERAFPVSAHVLAAGTVPFLDETIQLFVAGRSGQITDVWLDAAGVAFGTLLYVGGRAVLARRRTRRT